MSNLYLLDFAKIPDSLDCEDIDANIYDFVCIREMAFKNEIEIKYLFNKKEIIGVLLYKMTGEVGINFFCGDIIRRNMKMDIELIQIVFCGEGCGGSLREFRHTWWGENGYLFYLNKDLIVSAFNDLSKYFD